MPFFQRLQIRQTIVHTIGSSRFWDYFMAGSAKILARRFTSSTDESAPLKLYIIGHGRVNREVLGGVDGILRQSSADIANALMTLLKDRPKKDPLTISLIACEAKQIFAPSLMRELNKLGYTNVLIKARENTVWYFFGRKITFGKKYHFYIQHNEILSVTQENDLMYVIEKTLRKCLNHTPSNTKKAYLSELLTTLNGLGSFDEVKKAIQTASTNSTTQETQGWTRFFNCKSHTQRAVEKLLHKLRDVNTPWVGESRSPLTLT